MNAFFFVREDGHVSGCRAECVLPTLKSSPESAQPADANRSARRTRAFSHDSAALDCLWKDDRALPTACSTSTGAFPEERSQHWSSPRNSMHGTGRTSGGAVLAEEVSAAPMSFGAPRPMLRHAPKASALVRASEAVFALTARLREGEALNGVPRVSAPALAVRPDGSPGTLRAPTRMPS